MGSWQRLLVLAVWLVAPTSEAEPLDLGNSTPRWVSVEFEVSPAQTPGRLDSVYSSPFLAWFEPAGPHGARVTLDGQVVALRLLFDQQPKPGSFSDFQWDFDTSTGAVRAATLTGILYRTLDWGLFETRVETRIEILMSSERAAGFREPIHLLGHRLRHYCTDGRDRECTLVEPVGYQAGSGYVNAVGLLRARTGAIAVRTFSSLGEAVFSEFVTWRSPELVVQRLAPLRARSRTVARGTDLSALEAVAARAALN